jgi:hypothetical protein
MRISGAVSVVRQGGDVLIVLTKEAKCYHSFQYGVRPPRFIDPEAVIHFVPS